jgi:predicted nucleotidyltransferase
MREVIEHALTHQRVDVAFVFGSVARGEERPDSDLDIMVFGDVGLREMSPYLRPLHEQLGREVNAHFYTKQEVSRRLASRDHFFANVMASPRLFVIGDEQLFADWIEGAKGNTADIPTESIS